MECLLNLYTNLYSHLSCGASRISFERRRSNTTNVIVIIIYKYTTNTIPYNRPLLSSHFFPVYIRIYTHVYHITHSLIYTHFDSIYICIIYVPTHTQYTHFWYNILIIHCTCVPIHRLHYSYIHHTKCISRIHPVYPYTPPLHTTLNHPMHQ